MALQTRAIQIVLSVTQVGLFAGAGFATWQLSENAASAQRVQATQLGANALLRQLLNTVAAGQGTLTGDRRGQLKAKQEEAMKAAAEELKLLRDLLARDSEQLERVASVDKHLEKASTLIKLLENKLSASREQGGGMPMGQVVLMLKGAGALSGLVEKLSQEMEAIIIREDEKQQALIQSRQRLEQVLKMLVFAGVLAAAASTGLTVVRRG